MGAAQRVHVQQGADDLDAAKPCALSILRTGQTASVSRLVTRSEREQRRAVFCQLLRQRGAAAKIAEAWEVSPTMVRRVRDGLAPLTDERIAALPRSMRVALELALLGPVQLRLGGL